MKCGYEKRMEGGGIWRGERFKDLGYYEKRIKEEGEYTEKGE